MSVLEKKVGNTNLRITVKPYFVSHFVNVIDLNAYVNFIHGTSVK